MIWYLFLLATSMLGALRKSKILFTDAFTSRYRVWPWTTEVCTALQAGQYFNYCDAIQWEFNVRTGVIPYVLKNKIGIYVAGRKIIHRRKIPVFQSFEVRAQVLGWDEKFMYVLHVFHHHGTLFAVSGAKMGISRGARLWSPSLALAELGYSESPKVPDWVSRWFSEDVDVIRRFDSMRAIDQNLREP